MQVRIVQVSLVLAVCLASGCEKRTPRAHSVSPDGRYIAELVHIGRGATVMPITEVYISEVDGARESDRFFPSSVAGFDGDPVADGLTATWISPTELVLRTKDCKTFSLSTRHDVGPVKVVCRDSDD